MFWRPLRERGRARNRQRRSRRASRRRAPPRCRRVARRRQGRRRAPCPRPTTPIRTEPPEQNRSRASHCFPSCLFPKYIRSYFLSIIKSGSQEALTGGRKSMIMNFTMGRSRVTHAALSAALLMLASWSGPRRPVQAAHRLHRDLRLRLGDDRARRGHFRQTRTRCRRDADGHQYQHSPAIVSDSIQIGGPTLSTVFLQAVDGGLDLVAVAGASVMDPVANDLIVAVGRTGVRVKDPKDFVGKKVGAPGDRRLPPRAVSQMAGQRRASTRKA